MLPDLRFRITAQGATAGAFAGVRRDVTATNAMLARARIEAVAFGAAFRGIGGIIAGGAALRGAQELLDTSTRIKNALRVAGLEGDELTAVYGRLFESAQRNAAPVEALVSLYSRASLVQKELGISTEELLGFTDKVAVALRVSGKSAQESSGALLQLSQALGSGIVRAEEFNSILEGALPIAQAAAAGLEEAGGSVAKLRQLVITGKVSSEAFFRAFEAGADTLQDKLAGSQLTVSQGFVQLYNVMQDAAGRIDEVSGASKGAVAALNVLANVIELVTDKSSPFMRAIDGVNDHMAGLGGSLRRLYEDPSWANFWDALLVGTPTTPAEQRIRDVAAATDLLRDRMAKLKAETAQAEVGTRVPMTPGLDARFDDAFSARKTVSLADYAAPDVGGKAKDATDDLKLSVVELKDEFAEVRDLSRDFTRDLISGFMEGKSAAEMFGDALGNIGNRILDMGLDMIFAALMPQPGSINLPMPRMRPFGGARASGGPVSPDRSYLVGERGPELFTPRSAGNITPNGGGGGDGGRGGEVNVTINVSGGGGMGGASEIAAAVRRVVADELPPAIRRARANRELG
jgi:tape measure domain-containing protein